MSTYRIDPSAPHGGVIRGFTLNPEFEHLSDIRDARFGEPEWTPEYMQSACATFIPALWKIVQEGEPSPEEFLAASQEANQYLVLSAESLFLEDRAWLTLVNASSVNPNQGIVFDASSKGSLSLHLSVNGGQNYCIIFMVEPLGPGIFEVVVGKNQAQYEDPNGRFTSVLVPLTSLSKGWSRVDLNRVFGVGFTLHAVHILSGDTSVD